MRGSTIWGICMFRILIFWGVGSTLHGVPPNFGNLRSGLATKDIRTARHLYMGVSKKKYFL